ncbi:CYTH-like domain-containing protein [Gorgonomyces haynaldii]|nr:CYTH-like domain-containing protein [Gorgonomyces haynaldii]
MEIELKLKLLQKEYSKLIQHLDPFKRGTDFQENYFFDNNNRDLERVRTNLRLRRVKNSVFEHYMTIKSKGTLVDGVSRIQELEVKMEQQDFDLMLANPPHCVQLMEKYDILKTIPFGLDTAFQVGYFKNKRIHFHWEGLHLEVDETEYSFGTAYEIEVEHEQPAIAKEKLSRLLLELEIGYRASTISKFGTMLKGEITI